MNINGLSRTNAPILNFDLQQKSFSLQKTPVINNTDNYTFLQSMNFSDDEIKGILDASFQLTSQNANENTSIPDYTDSYKQTLDKINSDKNLSDDEKKRLTKVLDNCFDTLSSNVSGYLSHKIASFFNSSYNLKQSLNAEGIDIGLGSNKLVDEASLKDNIQTMFSAAKVFYKNHPNSSGEDFENYLQKNFSNTTSLDNLSYTDFKNLSSLFNKSDFKELISSLKTGDSSKDFDPYNNGLAYLRSHGSSDIVINGFITATTQNTAAGTKFKTYIKLDKDFSSRIDFLKNKVTSLKDQIKSMGDAIDEINKEYEKELEAAKNKKLKKQILIAQLDDIMSGETKTVELLTKNHDRTMKKMTKKLSDLYNQLNDTSKELAEVEKNYKEFKGNTSKYIDNYLVKSKNQKSINKKASNATDNNSNVNDAKIENRTKTEDKTKLQSKVEDLLHKIEVEKQLNM